ncbi:hypothetical protein Hanom_Chr11g01042281 [Helianthus anomalus]
MVRNFKFPDSGDARYPDEGQAAADAPSGYITLFRDFFSAGNFRLLVKNFSSKFFCITSFTFLKCTLLGWFMSVILSLPTEGYILSRQSVAFECSIKCTVHRASIRLCNVLQQRRFCLALRNLFTIGSQNSSLLKSG